MNKSARSNPFDDFPWEPLMFWEDITYIFQIIGNLFKKLFGLGGSESEAE